MVCTEGSQRTFSFTEKGTICKTDDIRLATTNIIHSYEKAYKDMLYQLPAKHVSLLAAISKEGKAEKITGGAFIKKHHLASASSVQKTAANLLERQIVTNTRGVYEVYDKFMALWLAGKV